MLVEFATAPLTWSVLLALTALFLLRRRNTRAAIGLTALAVVTLGTFSSPAVAAALDGWGQSSAVDTYRPDVTYDAVLIPGSGLDERVRAAGEIIRAGRARNVLYSGALGSASVQQLGARFRRWGLDDQHFVVEVKSRNTRENALEAARIVADRGWERVVMVTSASHVARALGAYRAEGMSPDVLAVDRHAIGACRQKQLGTWPSMRALWTSEAVLHEALGRVVYRALGYTSPG
jgi:uncharacterized SAM-binding protein YcdF (DUF218 family)